MKKNSIVISIICLVVIVAFLIIRKNEKTQITNTPAPKQISLYHYFSGTLSGGLVEMVDMVNKRQQDYIVSAHALDHEAFKSMIYTTLAKKNPPELFTYWAGAKVQELVDHGKLVPIDDLWEKRSFDKRFSRTISEAACTYNDKKYLLPITQHVVVFFYNKSIFDLEKLTPPATWEEFVTICSHLKTKKITPIALGALERWPAQFWLDYLLLRTAGPEYRAALMTGQAAYTDKEVREVYKTWSELLQQEYFNNNANQIDWSEATELVIQGKAAMTLMGTWAIQLLTNEKHSLSPGEDFDFFSFPIMDNTIPKVAVGPIDGLVLTHDSANHEFAKSVLTYFSEQELQQKMSLGSGAMAPSSEVPADFYSSFKQRILKEIELSPHWAFNYDLATPPDIAEKGMDSFNELIEFPDQHQAILENLQTEIQDFFNNKSSSRQKKFAE